MGDPAIIAAAIVLVLSSLGGTVVLIINAMSASKDRREASQERLQQLAIATETRRKTDTLVESTAKIHELTNSTNSNLQKALELMTERAGGLEKVIAELREAKRTTAAAQAMTDQRTAMLTPVSVSAGPAAVQQAQPQATPSDPLSVVVENAEPVRVMESGGANIKADQK